MSSPIEDKIQMIKDNKISEINLGGLEIDEHWAGKIAEALSLEVLFSNIRFENIRIYSNILTFEVAF